MSTETNAKAVLLQIVDEMATRAVLWDGAADCGEWEAPLREIEKEASSRGWTEVAATAQAMQASSETSPVLDPSARSFEAELAALREAIDRAASAAAPPAPSSLAQDRELLEDFLGEAREHLTSVESSLLELEKDTGNAEAVHSIFRSFHTIKGLAGFLELHEVRDVSHEVESLLDLARNGARAVTPDFVDVVLEAADYISTWNRKLGSFLASGTAIDAADPAPLVRRIQAVAEANLPEAPAATGDVTTAPEKEVKQDAAAEAPAAPSPKETPTAAGSNHARSVKVETGKLDYLVDMVGEMVIAQSLIRNDPFITGQTDPRLGRNLMQLARITDELQRTAMSMRMVPISHLFQKMSRLVRDLSRKSKKSAELITAGETTELDRNIVEELADPLMHMVRNSVDHGIETPAERAATGKPPTAQVSLPAAHQAGCIIIEISDDGRGLNKDRILAKATQKGIVAPGANLSESEIYSLIFQPGFSTAEKITDVSGRGVGMDVVKKQITKMRGRIEIHSTPGKGTTFVLKLPLTLAIVDGLVVRVAGQRFILPIHTVKELVKPAPDSVHTIENRAEVILVRGELLPLVRMARRFQLAGPRCEEASEGIVVVLESDGRRYGLLVDELLGKQEVVIKSLGEMFSHVVGVAGGAILGDGRVGLILDPESMFSAVRNG